MDQHQIGMTTLSSHPYGISRKVGFIAGTPPASSRSNTRLSAIKWRFPSDPTITTTAIRASTAPTKLSKDFMFFAVSYFFDYSKELDRAFTPSSFFSNHPGDFYTLGQDSIFCPLTCQITNSNLWHFWIIFAHKIQILTSKLGKLKKMVICCMENV